MPFYKVRALASHFQILEVTLPFHVIHKDLDNVTMIIRNRNLIFQSFDVKYFGRLVVLDLTAL